MVWFRVTHIPISVCSASQWRNNIWSLHPLLFAPFLNFHIFFGICSHFTGFNLQLRNLCWRRNIYSWQIESACVIIRTRCIIVLPITRNQSKTKRIRHTIFETWINKNWLRNLTRFYHTLFDFSQIFHSSFLVIKVILWN